jgi:hypothetical protein
MSYYSLDDAMDLLNTFASWIGKKAHVGDGSTEMLKAIEIKESSRIVKAIAPEKKYAINFRFENKKVFTAKEFLEMNGLTALKYKVLKNRQEQWSA